MEVHLITVPEAAEVLRVKRQTVYRWITEGKIPGELVVRVGGLMRLNRDPFLRWVNSGS